MAATIRYAKYLAKASNEKQILDIDLDSKTYAVEGRDAKKIPSDIIVTVLDSNLDAIRKGRYYRRILRCVQCKREYQTGRVQLI
jgi:L-lactate utilization protein LutB